MLTCIQPVIDDWDAVATACTLERTTAVLEAGKEAEQADGHKNALGTINGCYVPCLLNIMGIVLFMRLPWVSQSFGGNHARHRT